MSFADILASISGFLELGGPVVAVLAGLSVVALTVVILKLAQFWTQRVGRPGRAEAAVRLWGHGRRREAWQALGDIRSASEEAVAIAMQSGEGGKTVDKALVEEDIARAATRRLHRYNAGMKALDAIAQIAPLLGLFGTVLGMIEAFQKLQSAGNAVDPSLLAGGIWVALLTTAVGLAVAMPVSLVVTYLEGQIENEKVAIETLASAVLLEQARGGARATFEEVEAGGYEQVANAH
ncbi:MotA/TolQ/ExbB proton channel family protein [Stappia indica]|uniref:Outer membrane transport energization protein ExbB n=1 Tax=Stappia indica TaxID=538381 RepID=A0A285TU29_9HYPH|nr:MotA/TolQ/ExbB proton channel family protein [Stappia indica]MCC4245912.1 MotA/TolQ/ExbB proton channel family protein [Stappia indica]SOC27623.1 outer membrane transport energization protein ExbB [Stappia indica]